MNGIYTVFVWGYKLFMATEKFHYVDRKNDNANEKKKKQEDDEQASEQYINTQTFHI